MELCRLGVLTRPAIWPQIFNCICTGVALLVYICTVLTYAEEHLQILVFVCKLAEDQPDSDKFFNNSENVIGLKLYVKGFTNKPNERAKQTMASQLLILDYN